MNKLLTKELIFMEKDPGVMNISIVPNPAIEKDFFTFKVEPKYYYTLKPEYVGDPMVIDTSHNLCRKYAKGDAVPYSMNIIKGWSRYTGYKGWGFIEGSDFFNTFPATIDLSNAMYGCRHMLKRVDLFQSSFSFDLEFEAIDTKPRRIKGPVMIGNKLLLRPPEQFDGKNYGYVWFSNETIEKLQEYYGINSTTTFLHEVDITKNIIMTKSWIDKSNDKHWEWWAEYHILSDFIWDQIQSKQVRGFSVEIGVSAKT